MSIGHEKQQGHSALLWLKIMKIPSDGGEPMLQVMKPPFLISIMKPLPVPNHFNWT